MADEPTQPGAPPPLTDAQELLVLAQRLDGFMEWLGGPNHTGWHHIQDMPDKIRALARKQLLAAHQPGEIVRDAATGAPLYCIEPGKLVLGTLDGQQPQNPAHPLASGSGPANTPGNENARPEPPEGVLDMRGMLRRTPVPDFEPDLDTPFQAGRPIL